MRYEFFLVVLMIFFSSILRAEIDYPLTPEAILLQIESRNLADVHDEIFSHPHAVNMVLLAIDSAESGWLDVAELFLGEENPISGPRLIMAIGEGLQWHPANVLQRDFPIERICSLEGLYEWRLFSRFLTDTSIQRRLLALDGLANPGEKAEHCQKLLIRARRSLESTMNNKLPEHQH